VLVKVKTKVPGRPRKKKPGKSGGGGAWRSYVRKRMMGRKAALSFAKIAEEYRNLDAVQRHEHARIGADATYAHRHIDGNASSFGPRPAQAKRASVKDTQRREFEICQHLSASEQLATIRSSVQYDDVSSCLKGVRALNRHATYVKKDKKLKIQDTVAKYQDTIGKDALEQLVSDLPCLVELKDALRAVPSPLCCPCFEYTPASASNATESMSWLSSKRKLLDNKVSDAVWARYLREHEMFKHASCPKIPQRIEAVDGVAECASAGICVHQGSGLLLRHQCNRLLLAMKAQAPVGSAVRKQIDEGQIVLQFVGESLGDDGDDGLEFYAHIGLMYWNPYRPTFHKVEKVPKDESLPFNPARIYVKAAPPTLPIR
jgi:hypothetical protein